MKKIPSWLKVLLLYPIILIKECNYNGIKYLWKLIFLPPTLNKRFPSFNAIDYILLFIVYVLFASQVRFTAIELLQTQPLSYMLVLITVGIVLFLYFFGIPIYMLILSILILPIFLIKYFIKIMFPVFTKEDKVNK
jgi:hypothetical protein